MKTKFIGHRGARSESPENTLMGIKFALEQGLAGVEIDVHLSSDGELMVIHDASVNRTTGGEGLVLELNCKDLKNLDAGEGEEIPTLAEVIDLVKAHNGILFIELKASGCEQKVIELIKAKDFAPSCILKSFNHHFIKRAKTIDPSIKAQCLMYALPINPVEIINACEADGISISTIHLDEQLVKACHKKNLFVTTWNANDHETLNKFKAMGVDYVCTDFATLISSMPF
ncbi:MAG: glycerophosphodiester phosphodiesterase [Deltaproteobacteria bacterium]|nr:MAG: glycerophosphodiester phosphodiesterase [Deltaproteobacteria bacterium]